MDEASGSESSFKKGRWEDGARTKKKGDSRIVIQQRRRAGAEEEEIEGDWVKRKCDSQLRDLLVSGNSKEEQEVEQKTAGQQELVEQAASWNKDVTVEELLEGGCDKKHGMLEDSKEWYKKPD